MKTIEQLVGRSLRAENLQSSVTIRAESVGRKHPEELTAADIAFCLRQNLAREHVLPLAITLLCEQPFLQAEFYPGDLLHATLELPSSFWTSNPSLYEEVVELRWSVEAAMETINQEIQPLLSKFHYESPP